MTIIMVPECVVTGNLLDIADEGYFTPLLIKDLMPGSSFVGLKVYVDCGKNRYSKHYRDTVMQKLGATTLDEYSLHQAEVLLTNSNNSVNYGAAVYFGIPIIKLSKYMRDVVAAGMLLDWNDARYIWPNSENETFAENRVLRAKLEKIEEEIQKGKLFEEDKGSVYDPTFKVVKRGCINPYCCDDNYDESSSEEDEADFDFKKPKATTGFKISKTAATAAGSSKTMTTAAAAAATTCTKTSTTVFKIPKTVPAASKTSTSTATSTSTRGFKKSFQSNDTVKKILHEIVDFEAAFKSRLVENYRHKDYVYKAISKSEEATSHVPEVKEIRVPVFTHNLTSPSLQADQNYSFG